MASSARLLVLSLVALVLGVPPVVASDASCTEVIGFSQTREWYEDGGFEGHVDDPARWQLRWRSGAVIGHWSDPGYEGWDPQRLHHPCADGSVERVVLTISGGTSSNVDSWAEMIASALPTVRDKHPGAQILLQPVVGGPDYGLCYHPHPEQGEVQVRASFNAPYIAEAAGRVAADHADVAVGALPTVASCDQYRDGVGHLDAAGAAHVAATLGAFYSGDGGDLPPARRLAGATRVETAVAVSADTFAPGVERVFVATGWAFPDALSAGPFGVPVLLTAAESLPDVVRDEVARLDPGAVVVLGGTEAVSAQVVRELEEASGAPVRRIAGPDRYATAAAVATDGFDGPVPVAFVATGEAFPDALAAGPLAAEEGGPLLLVRPDEIPAATADALDALRPARIVVLGGPAAVSAAVADQLAGFTDGDVERLSGADRYATALAASQSRAGAVSTTTYLASGEDFPDALATGPAAAATASPLLLVRAGELPGVVADELGRSAPEALVVVGGEAAVSASVETAARQAAASGP